MTRNESSVDDDIITLKTYKGFFAACRGNYFESELKLREVRGSDTLLCQ